MPSYVQQVLPTPPSFIDTGSYAAKYDRQVADDVLSPGVVIGFGFLSVVGGLTVRVGAGSAYVDGLNTSDQGLYRVNSSSQYDLTCTAANLTLPRLDQVILRVLDNASDGSGANEARIEIIPGNPTSGATLDNRSGAANLATLLESSKSVLLLFDVLVPAGATTLVTGNIRDKRAFSFPKGAIQISNVGQLDPTVLPQGLGMFLNNDHGGTLYKVEGGTYKQISLPLRWTAVLITWNVTLPADNLRHHLNANAGTLVSLLDTTTGSVHTSPDPDLYVTEPGWYWYWAKHRSSVAGSIGLEVWMGSSGPAKIAGQNKTLVFGGDATSKDDAVLVAGLQQLDPTSNSKDKIFCQLWHSAGATDIVEFGIIKMPVS